jgi:hypothetical protein
VEVLGRVAVGSDHDPPCAHRARGRRQHVPGAVLVPALDRRVGVDRRAPAVGGLRQAPRVLQGMEPEGRADTERAMGGGAPRDSLAGQPLAIQELHVPEVQALVVDAEPLP